MNDRVLVTGATGFLGSHLCPALAERGWAVHGLRRPTSDLGPLADADVEWHVGDVLDADSVRAAVDGCDAVCHLAGIGLMSADEETVRRVNVEGTRTVMDACEAAGVERVVFTSTAGTRRSDGVANEADLADPVGAYQESKASAERVVDEYAADGLDAVTVHPTSVFGPRDRKFTARLLALATDPKLPAYLPGGASIVGVDDVVDGIEAALRRGRSGEHYLLGGENLTYGDALSVIAAAVDGHRPLVPVPATVIHAAGPVAGLAGERLDRRVFPFNADMARLSTRELFYTSAKANRELGYEFQPLREHVSQAARWFDGVD